MGGFGGGFGPGFGMMGGWGFPFSGIFGLLILVLVVVALVWFVRALTRPRERLPETGRRSAGLDLLDQRYARGEINRDEYLQKRADVLG
jgi:putative membrane protein